YGTAFLKYQTSTVELDFTHAHNDYLEFATDLGGLGFLVFTSLMAMIFVKAFRTMKHGQEWNLRLAGLGCAGAAAALALHSVVDFNLQMRTTAWMLGGTPGPAAGLPVPPLAPESTRTDLSVRMASIALSCLLVIAAPARIVTELRAQGLDQTGTS